MNTSKPVLAKETATNSIENNEKNNSDKKYSQEHSFVLSKREAEAASPADMAVCGEEDPGEALEFLVAENTSTKDHN